MAEITTALQRLQRSWMFWQAYRRLCLREMKFLSDLRWESQPRFVLSGSPRDSSLDFYSWLDPDGNWRGYFLGSWRKPSSYFTKMYKSLTTRKSECSVADQFHVHCQLNNFNVGRQPNLLFFCWLFLLLFVPIYLFLLHSFLYIVVKR